MLNTKYEIGRDSKVLRARLNLQGLHLRLYGNRLPSITYYTNPTQENLDRFHTNLVKIITGTKVVPDAFLPDVEGLGREKHNLIVLKGKKKGWLLLKIVNLNLEKVFEMNFREQELLNIVEEGLSLYSNPG